MEYNDFIEDVMSLGFISDEYTADAAVKATLGILASKMKEEEAKKLTAELPDPLTLEKLRGHQQRVTPTTVEQYIEEISDEFLLNHEEARELVDTVLHTAKDAVGGETLSEIEKKLPPDWAEILENA